MKRSLLALAAALAVAAPAAAQTWDIDTAHSSAQFSVKHLMVSTVRGDFGKTTGTIEFDGKNVSSIKVNATIDATSINTRNEGRDKHLKSADFFDVEKFPTITFTSKSVAAAGAGKFKVTGDLTMRGVTKQVVLDVDGPSAEIKGTRGETRIGATATTTINRQDFGVSWSRALDGGGVVVSDQVQITIDLELIKKAAA
ncbi:MAG: YceI family protein [Acidobacteria bacterium]|nr:YceI family protein [Acidobacteriota bacterium]